MKLTLTLLIQHDTTPNGEPGFMSLCPELDIASQGDTEDEAHSNLLEAIHLFIEDTTPEEIEQRLAVGAKVSQLELAA